MKRTLVVILALVLVFSLTACNASEEANAPQGGEPAEQQPETPGEPEGETTEDPGADETDEPEVSDETPQEEPEVIVETPLPDEPEPGSLKENVNGVDVDYVANDLVVIENYEGYYGDTLKQYAFDIGTGEDTYTVAIFGSVSDLQYIIGEQYSGASIQDLEPHVKDALITFRGVESSEGETVSAIDFADSNGERYRLKFTKAFTTDDVLVVEDSGLYDPLVEEGHWLKAKFEGHGYIITVEVDEVEEIVPGVNVNYLYIQEDAGEKRLLAQSVDNGRDFVESIGNILNPTFNSDASKLYYETDETFTQSSGYGAKNHRTRVIDLSTNQDRYFEEGAIAEVLTWGNYQDHVILQTSTRDDDGQIVPFYSVYKPNGELLVQLDYLDPFEPGYQIEQAVTN